MSRPKNVAGILPEGPVESLKSRVEKPLGLPFRGAVGDGESRQIFRCQSEIPRYARNDSVSDDFLGGATAFLTPDFQL